MVCLSNFKVSTHLVDVAEQASEFQRRFGKTLEFKGQLFPENFHHDETSSGGFPEIILQNSKVVLIED